MTSASATIATEDFMRSLGKRERVHRVPRGNGHELAAVPRVAHRRGRHVRAGLEMPQMLAAFRVERDEVAVADRAEHEVAGGRQDAVGQRALENLEVPYRLARFRIESFDAGR